MAPDRPRPGLNFVTCDYLALTAHPDIRAAARAARDPLPPAASSHRRVDPVQDLEVRLAAFLHLPAALAFSSGTEAIRATLLGLLGPQDDIIVDAGAHPAMFEAARAARAGLHRSPAGSVEAMERRLSRLGRHRRGGRLYLAVPAVSTHGSRTADLADLAFLARLHGACLIADVTHDLGAMGQDGRGLMEIQGCLGRVDVVVGSLARTFAAHGGFAALRDPSHMTALQQALPRRATLAPVNARVILAALGLVDSAEGRHRRRRLHGCALRLRNHLMGDGLRVLGQAAPFVPVRLPIETAQAHTRLLESAGPMVTLLQAPTVPGHAPRWRFRLTADHSAADIDDLADLIRDVTRLFDRQTRHSIMPETLASG